MNFCQALQKVSNKEDSYLQVDSKTLFIYDCPMCDHKSNSVDDLKQHLTETHEEPQCETKTIKEEKLCETLQDKGFNLMNERNHVKVQKELMENHGSFFQDLNLMVATNNNDNSIENEAKSEESLTTVKLEDLNSSNSYGQSSFFKTEDASVVEFYICKEEPESHMKLEPSEDQHCHKSFDETRNLENHPRMYTAEKLFKCLQCQTSFAQPNHLKDHLRTHAGEKPFKCAQCPKSFNLSFDLICHIQTHTGEKFLKCLECQKWFALRNNLKQHLKTHIMKTSGALKYHLQTYTVEKPFQCLQCQTSFAQSNHFINHLRTHKERPFKCLQCQTSFAQSNHLKNHLRTHTERLYKCSECPKSFVLSSVLKSHLLTHTKKKPLTTYARNKPLKWSQCPTCSKYFTCSSHFETHLPICRAEKVFKCQYMNHESIHDIPLKCESFFNTLPELKIHIKTHVEALQLVHGKFYI